MFFFFPACQVRVVRFYVSCLPPPPPRSPAPLRPRPPPPTPPPPPRPQPPASDGSVPAGSQLQVQDGSVPRRTSTARSGWQCSPLDLNREFCLTVFPELRLAVFPAGPQPQVFPRDLKRQLFVD